MNKKRMDIILYERGLFESREKARAAIMAGEVYIKNKRVDKPGMTADCDDLLNQDIEIRGGLKYVSRGGLKLEKAILNFKIDLNNKICADIGASTGGFTDCMLRNGAAKVYAVDVGYGQFAWKLRNDSRVICLERTNARYLTREIIPDELDFASVDVSFISLRLILPVLRNLIKNQGFVICLIKPQFEAGREFVGKKGVVRDKKIHEKVLKDFLEYAAESDFRVLNITWSPIRGPEGNIEYLGFLLNNNNLNNNNLDLKFDSNQIPGIVEASHLELDN